MACRPVTRGTLASTEPQTLGAHSIPDSSQEEGGWRCGDAFPFQLHDRPLWMTVPEPVCLRPTLWHSGGTRCWSPCG